MKILIFQAYEINSSVVLTLQKIDVVFFFINFRIELFPRSPKWFGADYIQYDYVQDFKFNQETFRLSRSRDLKKIWALFRITPQPHNAHRQNLLRGLNTTSCACDIPQGLQGTPKYE